MCSVLHFFLHNKSLLAYMCVCVCAITLSIPGASLRKYSVHVGAPTGFSHTGAMLLLYAPKKTKTRPLNRTVVFRWLVNRCAPERC